MDNLMARSKPRIDVIKRLGNAVVFSIDDRLAVEAKYGHKLTSTQWKQITDVTSILMELIPGLKDATPLSVVLVELRLLEISHPRRFTGRFLLIGGIVHHRVRSGIFSTRYLGL